MSETWYVGEGMRGQQLLEDGRIEQATEVFEAILTRLGDAPSYERAVILGRLGRCFHLGGRPDLAVRYVRDAMAVVGRLPPSDGVKGLRGTLRSELGDALRAKGEYGEARKAYGAALKIAEELDDLRSQGVELARLGALALTEGELEEALRRQDAARRLFHQLDEPEMEAAAWHQLGKIYHKQQRWDEAERHYREAERINTKRGRLAAAAQTRSSLADLLRHQPGRLADARQLAEEALTVLQNLSPAAPDTWANCGILADIAEKEAQTVADIERRAALEIEARDYRELQRHVPAIVATLARMSEGPSCGRAVLLGQLGRSFQLAKRPDLAVAYYRQAISSTSTLASSDGVEALCGALHADLGDVFHAIGRDAEARAAHEAALKIAEALQDLRGQARLLPQLGRVFVEDRHRDDALAFEVTIHEDLITEYVFEPDLLVDGPRERRMVALIEELDLLADGVRPALPPCTRTWMDEQGAVRFSLASREPSVQRLPECTVLRRRRLELAVSGNPGVLWTLIQEMDGASTVGDILSRLSEDERAVGARMLAALRAAGALDVSGRPVGRFLHLATKKGVLPAGGLEGDAAVRLATDGNYRAYPEAPRIAVSQSVPGRLRAFHSLTRARRSSRDYGGPGLGRGDFDALLHTACGVTGAMPWAEREVQLRAYPSSGALYAVEIYPVVFRVESLGPGVYHYRAVENVLEAVRLDVDPASVVGAALPVEREMVAGAAVLFCLTGCFPRHERKYGEGGYRMMAAEAGHISQNLILAATALGLSTRPFGGVFDDLLNRELGLATADEQFLLAVLVGHASSNEK
jgi:SagB-type dehydrogenase family enzyme